MDNKEAVNVLMTHRVRFRDDFGWDQTTIEALDVAISSLTTESKSVVKGEWVNVRFSADGSSSADCNRCGATVHTSFSNSVNFCPNCGADMREGK